MTRQPSTRNLLTDTTTLRLRIEQLEDLRKLTAPITASSLVRVLLDLYFAGRLPQAIIPIKNEVARVKTEFKRSRSRFESKKVA